MGNTKPLASCETVKEKLERTKCQIIRGEVGAETGGASPLPVIAGNRTHKGEVVQANEIRAGSEVSREPNATTSTVRTRSGAGPSMLRGAPRICPNGSAKRSPG